jgi:hypothetical protein
MSVSRLVAAAAVFSSAALVAGAGTSAQCCGALATAIGSDQVILPNTTAYTERLEGIWAATARKAPWCFVRPASTKDVSAVITTLTSKECPFGILSGGHGWFSGANSVEDGVTIDFKYLNTTTYDADAEVAHLEPGGTWASAYKVLGEHGVVVVGGRVSSVGIGGYLLGGGISFYSARYGFAADNIINYEIVLADGTITNANHTENPDLFRALKGGSGNFGLVTRFDMSVIHYPKTCEPGDIWGGLIAYDPENEEAVDGLIESFIEYAHITPAKVDTSAVIWWVFAYAAGGMTMAAGIDQTQNNGNDPAFDKIRAVPSIQNTLRHTTLVNLTDEVLDPGGLHYISLSAAFKADGRIIKFAKLQHDQLIKDIEALIGTDTGLSSQTQFQPLSRQLVLHGDMAGGNVMGLEEHVAADGDGINWIQLVGVNSAENLAAISPLVQNVYDAVKEYAETIDANWNWDYLNYSGGTQDPLGSTGVSTQSVLKEAAAKYDPKGVFQKLRRSGFKLSEASVLGSVG